MSLSRTTIVMGCLRCRIGPLSWGQTLEFDEIDRYKVRSPEILFEKNVRKLHFV